MSLTEASNGTSDRRLSWWTWVVPLPIFFLGTLISLEAKITTGTSLLYLPLAFGLTLAYWWGPRVLPAFYLNASACAGLWGLSRVELWAVYGLPETVFVALSWLFFVKIISGKIWLPDTKQMIYFLITGIMIPLVIYKFMLESIFMLAGDAPVENYWNLLITTGFGDFISTFCVSLPLLHFLTPWMAKRELLLHREKIEHLSQYSRLRKVQWLEFLTVAIIASVINLFLDFIDYWFLNGILSLYVAMRFGFGATVLMNSYMLIITYMVPAAIHHGYLPHFAESQMLRTQLGTALLYVFTIITGRLVSDMRLSEARLNERNNELNQMNSELDRFVYSVSHDLSAPLKSILGLVSISRLTTVENEHRHHFDLIERSAYKLEAFVAEVLDYSRNRRTEGAHEPVNLKDLSQEVFQNLQFADGFNEIAFEDAAIKHEWVISDRSRLKMILQNLLSNAIKFRNKTGKPFIRLSTQVKAEKLMFSIEDNGEGIRPELKHKIFDMFFRGSHRSDGSGLGLYIAREAAKKIDATLEVTSTYGEGSVFTIALPASVVPVPAELPKPIPVDQDE
ncbi:Signal transduction histidine kinase [Chryseolinea serpens]|uniref:histidine kinase n=1 Tax=Chryseolinea serpens TaxID=947013 RepID=A0A1M5JQP9_9BACT|nr:ATP-binding protein [Chryseolinea serpens]SHG42906.1 Signal transduction histidine kinase [Chryseolinea serpens]